MISLSALILTYNEEANIGRTLGALSWLDTILIVDSGSTDNTLEIARHAHPTVKIVTRPFDTFASQCNFGLTQVQTEWVLSLDADYVVSPELAEKVRLLDPPPETAGYSVPFRYCVFGRPLHYSLYPERTVIYRRSLARYRDEGHGHRVSIDGKVENLTSRIDHDDRKPLSRWLAAQDRYATAEANHLLGSPIQELEFQDRLRRRIFFAPPAIVIYLLFVRGLLFDGWPGWFYVGQRTVAELLLSLRLLVAKCRRKNHAPLAAK